MSGEALALASATCFAISNVTIARGARPEAEDNGAFVSLLITTVISGAAWIAAGLARGFEPVTPRALAWFAGAGVLTAFIGRVFFYASVQRLGAMRSSTLKRLNPFFSVVLGVVVLGDQLTGGIAIGLVLILASFAALLAGAGGNAARPAGANAGSFMARFGYAYGIVSALGYSSGYLLRKMGLNEAHDALLGTMVGCIVGALLFAATAAFNRDYARAVRATFARPNPWLIGAGESVEDPTCSAQRQSFLDGYLTSLGVSHTIVTTTDAFKVAFRSGAYNTYWITGGATKLLEPLVEEVREAALRGGTLIVDGAHDDRNNVLDEVVGINFKGKPTGITTVTLASGFLPSGSFTVSGSRPLRVELTTALRQGVFNTGDPAIATNVYGRGMALLFAFDLTGTLQAQAASVLLSTMLGDAIDEVAPAVPLTFTGGAYVPLTITLASGATQSLDWAVRTPDASGTYSISALVTQTYGSTTVTVGTYPIAITVSGLDTQLAGVIASLQALALTASADQKARDNALAKLQQAQSQIAAANWEGAIATLIDVNNQLDGVTGVNVLSYEAAIDNVLKEVERVWWSALPACPAAPLCRTP